MRAPRFLAHPTCWALAASLQLACGGDGGDDSITAGLGNQVFAGSGNDVVVSDGSSTLDGGLGNDNLRSLGELGIDRVQLTDLVKGSSLRLEPRAAV